ncbi:MAG: DUF3332 domain-containing protein [Bacteroidetes bacterium]|nr:DUF3332 domain-containing protein [Bacteroidota bacterium]
MKKGFLSLVVLCLMCTPILNSCMGSFNLTKKVYSWNQSIGDKWVNEIVFFCFACIIPVYSITLFADGVIFNLIEFWTSSNPVAMNENDVNEKIITKNGKDYRLTISKEVMTAEEVGNSSNKVEFAYNKADQSWSMATKEGTKKVISMNGENVTVYGANDEVITYSANVLNNVNSTFAME